MLGAVFNSNNSRRWFAKEMPPGILLPGHSSLLLPTRKMQLLLLSPSQPPLLIYPDRKQRFEWDSLGLLEPRGGFGRRWGRELEVGMSPLSTLSCRRRRRTLWQRSFHGDTAHSYAVTHFCHRWLSPTVNLEISWKRQWSSRPQNHLWQVLADARCSVVSKRHGHCLSLHMESLSCWWWKPTTQLKQNEWLCILGLSMRSQGPGTQIWVASNTMLQPSNNFMEFYSNRTKRKSRHFQSHWRNIG